LRTSSLSELSCGTADRWNLQDAGALLDAAEDTLRPGGLGLTEYALECCNFPDGSSILDAGCGTAATARHLVKGGRLAAVGVDRSSSLLAEARRLCAQVPLICAELERLPLADASFDGVVCECVLSQTSGHEVISELRRVLRPDGYLILTDLYRKTGGPAATSPMELLATREQTVDLLEAAGFETVLWEDRTAELKQLALRLIMASGPSQGNLSGWSRQLRCSSEPAASAWWQGVGYHLVISRRNRT